MNNENAFLDCNIWSVHLVNQPYIENNFFLVETIYYYNSLTSGIIVFNTNCIQIPEFEINDLHLLNNINYDFINKHSIPILCKINEYWKIDLTHYQIALNNIDSIENEYDKNISM